MEKLRVAVLPAGAWGAAFSRVGVEAGHDVRLYFRYEGDREIFDYSHSYPRRLPPEIVFPESIQALGNFEQALTGAGVVVLAPPSKYLRGFYREIRPFIPSEASILCLTKGLEQGTNLRMSQVLEEEDLGISQRLAILSGPNLARDIAVGKLAFTVVASTDISLAKRMQMEFSTESFRIYTTDDVIGLELGGAFKNVMALAAGAGDGSEMGASLRSALIGRALNEMINLALVLGAKEETLRGLSGLGDLVLTCTSPDSRNYVTGFEIAQGANIEELVNSGRTVEGFYAVRAMVALASQYGIDVPIAQMIYRVLYEGLTIEDAKKILVNRPLIHENGRI